MWKKCGFVRDEENLLDGLLKLEEIKKRNWDLDVRTNKDNFQDLIVDFNIKSVLISAEATILSTLSKKRV